MPGFSHGPVGGMLELSHWLGIWIHGGPLQPTIMPGLSHGPVWGGVLDLSHWLEIWIYGGPLQPTNRHKTSCQTL